MVHQPKRGGKAGLGVDSDGGPVIDPTENVIALVKAEARAAAMFRKADRKYNDAMFTHLKEIGILRATNAETLRIGDLDRLSKTREVDVLAGSASAATLATAVQTLANTSDRNAETLRNTLNATAATMAKQTSDQAAVLSSQTDSLVKDINNRIAELQKSQYQGVGKNEGFSTSWTVVLAVAGLLALFYFNTNTKTPTPDPTIAAILQELKTERAAAAPVAPQVIYVPAPAGSLLPTTPPQPTPR